MNQLAYVVCFLVAASCGSHPAKGELITDWNSAILDAIRNESTASPLAARNLAIVHAAIFDAVNAIDRTHDAYMFRPNPTPGASLEAAAIGAAYESLVRLYPSQKALFDQTLGRTLNAVPPGQSRDDGYALGQLVALLTLTWRNSDGSSTSVPYVPSIEPGQWRRTPPFNHPPEFPQWPYVAPFALTNGAQFRPPPPPALSDTQYTTDFVTIKELGASGSFERTAEEAATARFWSDFSYTSTCPGHWNRIAQSVATNRPGTFAETARLFALLNLGLADAGIAAWDAKYFYNFWRPVTAIREADRDGNPDTDANTNWNSFLTTPYFPEYVSEHSVFSSAAAAILTAFYGTDQVHFLVGSDILVTIRSYESFSEAAAENGVSRIYGGVNFQFSHLAGEVVGRQIGNFVSQNLLRPLLERASLAVERTSDYRLEIHLSGSPSGRYILQSSTNLLHWIPMITNTVPFTVEDLGTDTARFYRAIATP